MEISFSCADGGHGLTGGCRLLPRNLSRNSVNNWSNALLAALAVHLLVIFFSFAMISSASPPPFTPEQVVVVQLTELAPVAEVAGVAEAAVPPSATARPPEPLAKIAPAAPEKPLPRLEKKPKQASPKPASEARQTRSEKKTPAKPSPPAPTIAPAIESAASTTTETAQQAAAPVEARHGAATRPGQASATASNAISLVEPRPINQPKPAYPPQAQRRGLEGKVILRVTVGVDGAVRAVTVSRGSSYSLLDEAAVAGVWNWRFQPGQAGGEKKEMTISLPVDFRLR
jgi:protein TonB